MKLANPIWTKIAGIVRDFELQAIESGCIIANLGAAHALRNELVLMGCGPLPLDDTLTWIGVSSTLPVFVDPHLSIEGELVRVLPLHWRNAPSARRIKQ